MPKSLRPGFTTGSCAAAAAKAAALNAATGSHPSTVTITLPAGKEVTFPVEWDAAGRAVVVKDAGDDPDCTDGARLTAEVRLGGDQVLVTGGEGVGVVTKPGLGLPVGEAAINPVPRQMIEQAIGEVTEGGALVTISVPGGQEMASHTTNDRLGILGGISILGTTGIVRPFSTAAFRASIVQQIDVAAAQGERHIVLATGSRTEQAARRVYPGTDLVAVIEVGDFTGVAFKRAAGKPVDMISWFGMVGKVTKLAQGMLMTHFHRSDVSTDLLRTAAEATGSPAPVIEAAGATNTARHFYEACIGHGTTAPLAYLTEMAARNCSAAVANRVPVEIFMVDFDTLEPVCHAVQAAS